MAMLSKRGSIFREVIETFIDDRRDAKLEGKNVKEQVRLAQRYKYPTWLADAARRVEQIQAVTHVIKATHPDAKGTSLHVASSSLTDHEKVGSGSLKSQHMDVVGNAAALDVYKFLKLELEGLQLLAWFQKGDVDLLSALDDDLDIATTWAAAFKSLERTPEKFVSHSKTKQLYWSVTGKPAEDQGYQLLQPVFSSSFAQELHQNIQDVLYGEINKEARKARREERGHVAENRVYSQLAVRKIGGTKPQNISQLNSERGGVNYLLASLPPTWDLKRKADLLAVDSAFRLFHRDDRVRLLLNHLVKLLKDDPKAVMETRKKREAIEKELLQSLAAFCAEITENLEPGWSRDARCQLPLYERLWLDNARRELPVREGFLAVDQDFIDAYEHQEWPNQVAQRFAHWLNDILRRGGLPVGDTEHIRWAKEAIVYVKWLNAHQSGLTSVDS